MRLHWITETYIVDNTNRKWPWQQSRNYIFPGRNCSWILFIYLLVYLCESDRLKYGIQSLLFFNYSSYNRIYRNTNLVYFLDQKIRSDFASRRISLSTVVKTLAFTISQNYMAEAKLISTFWIKLLFQEFSLVEKTFII